MRYRPFLQISDPTNVPDRVLRAINTPTIRPSRRPEFAATPKGRSYRGFAQSFEQAMARKLDSRDLRVALYETAFVRADSDHRGIVLNFPLGALARLGLARSYALQGDSAKARTAYLDFLTLWKDADPDIPILKEAKAEYAKLQ